MVRKFFITYSKDYFLSKSRNIMSLLSNANKKNKKDNKATKTTAATGGGATVNKSAKSAGVAKKPVKTGGTRGS